MRRKIPATTALVGFEAAARHPSFTKAAEELALTQSAICRQIANLEDFLGVKLFRRTRRGVQLTEAGRNYSRREAWETPAEYAARAGTDTRWSFGDDESDLERYAWYGDLGGRPHAVGEKEPNSWGIHDMHGNVYEWVADWYGPYSGDPQVDPTGPPDGSDRVLRGGAFFFTPRDLRSAFRFRFVPEYRDGVIGFRCVRSPRRQP